MAWVGEGAAMAGMHTQCLACRKKFDFKAGVTKCPHCGRPLAKKLRVESPQARAKKEKMRGIAASNKPRKRTQQSPGPKGVRGVLELDGFSWKLRIGGETIRAHVIGVPSAPYLEGLPIRWTRGTTEPDGR